MAGPLDFNLTGILANISDILTKEKKLVKEVEIPSGHKISDYKVERIKAKSHDGRMIPITLVRRKDIELNGKSKLLEITSTKHKTKPVTVRFVKGFDEIVGVDLEKYGPFKPEDIATIPNENAQSLISNGIALKVRIEE